MFTWAANRHYCSAENDVPEVAAAPTVYPCQECGKPFKQPGIRALHRIRVHQVHPPTYYYVNTCHCPVCQAWCESITNVRAHIEHKSSCYVKLINDYPRLSEEQLAQVDIDVKIQKEMVKQAGYHDSRKRLDKIKKVKGPRNKSGPQMLAIMDTVPSIPPAASGDAQSSAASSSNNRPVSNQARQVSTVVSRERRKAGDDRAASMTQPPSKYFSRRPL